MAPQNEVTAKEVMMEVQNLTREFHDFTNGSLRSRDEMWKHINRIKGTVYGDNGTPSMITEIALLKAYKEQMEKNEAKRGYREWGIVLLLISLLIKAFFIPVM